MKTKQPKTGRACGCKRGVQRDNCPACEGTGMQIDFAAIRVCECLEYKKVGHQSTCRFSLEHSDAKPKVEHTPTPWKVTGNLNTIENAKGLTVCDLRSNAVDADADAAFIVRAVNNFESMLSTLKQIRVIVDAQSGMYGLGVIIAEVIAKAEGSDVPSLGGK